MLPLKDLIVDEFDLGIWISDFRNFFSSDNSTVEVDEFINFLFSSLQNGSPLMLPIVFCRILPLNGL